MRCCCIFVTSIRLVNVTPFVRKLRYNLYASNPLYHAYLEGYSGGDSGAGVNVGGNGYEQRQSRGGDRPGHIRIYFDKHLVEWVSNTNKRDFFAQAVHKGQTVATAGASVLQWQQDQKQQKQQKQQDQDSEQSAIPESTGLPEEWWDGESQPGQPGQSSGQISKESDAVAGHDENTSVILVPLHSHEQDRAWNILHNCSLVVGLHPDQATEPLIDFALRLNKPFVTIPCCTCSKDFPQRTIQSGPRTGKLVKAYADFVEYLKAKDSRIQEATLDFEGKNRVLYMI